MQQRIIPLSVFPWGMINAFLIRGSHKHILVDTGVPHSEDRLLKQIEKEGISRHDIGLIIVTHGHLDHFGSTAELKHILKVPVLVHEKDARALRTGLTLADTLKPNRLYWNILKRRMVRARATPCEPDIVLTGSNDYDLRQWGVAGKLIHTPGHTPGSLSVLLDDGNAVIMDLASSGILLGGILFRSRLKHPPFHDDKLLLKASIEKVLQHNGHTFYLGHGGPITRQKLTDYKNKFL